MRKPSYEKSQLTEDARDNEALSAGGELRDLQRVYVLPCDYNEDRGFFDGE
jgi:hypothetical protein